MKMRNRGREVVKYSAERYYYLGFLFRKDSFGS